jgi:hypothetical protein
MGEDMGTTANTNSWMVWLRDILAGILPDILAGLGTSVAGRHVAVRHPSDCLRR